MNSQEQLACAEIGDEEFVAVEGTFASGKTELLIRRVRALLNRGVGASSILLLVPSEPAVEEMSKRLAEAIGPSCLQVRVTTPLAYSTMILSSDSAKKETGRTPRILTETEAFVVKEDLKEINGKPGRNREIVKFLLRGWSEMSDDDDHFLISYEEICLNDGLKERLKMRGGMLRHEAAALAVRFLRGGSDSANSWRADYVLVDDCQSMCKASQILAESLHVKQVVLAGNSDQECEVVDPYPYAKGLQEFRELHANGDCAYIELGKSFGSLSVVRSVCNCMEGSSSLAGARKPSVSEGSLEGRVQKKKYLTLADELAGTANSIASMSADERKRTLVVVPSNAFGRRLEKALLRRGVCAEFLSPLPRSRWAKDERPGPSVRVEALLGIAVDPMDGVAWRMVFSCCFDLYGCGEWRELELYAERRGVSAVEAVPLLRSEFEAAPVDGTPHAKRILDAFDTTTKATEGLKGLKGHDLVRALANCLNVEERNVSAVLPQAIDGKGCLELLSALRTHAFLPAFGSDTEIRIGTPSALVGVTAQNSIVIGMLEGLFPSARAIDPEDTVDHRAHFIARDERVFYVASTRGREEACYSRCARDKADTAARLSMGISRIYAAGEEGRWALLKPSRFLGCLG